MPRYYEVAILGHKAPLLTYSHDDELKEGEVVEVSVKNSTKKAVLIREVPKPDFDIKPLCLVGERFLDTQITLCKFIAKYYFCTYGEAYGQFTPSFDAPSLEEEVCFELSRELSDEQIEALDFISKRDFSLLFGQTGSGKTEVYINLLAQNIRDGKNAILLIPEISLTPQMEKRLNEVFGQHIGVWHSKLGKKKRLEILESIKYGKIRILVGARSTLFLPLKNIGLIIVDEEHDDAYKSQSRPRYNARDLAIYIGNKKSIKVVLGSATPSLSSFYKAKNTDSIFRLKKYYSSHRNVSFLHQKTYISDELVCEIANSLDKKKQVIIFLPTRANFKSLICSDCGEIARCPFCSVSMSLHLDKNALMCHYCGYTQAIFHKCKNCDCELLHSNRIGTAQVAKELSEIFSKNKIEIFDRDNITTQKKLEKILSEFNDGSIDILVGTQMLSKGHDYHNVDLAVVMGLDYVLCSGDFRSNERAVSLLFQISGRSGRRDDGRVVLQSLNDSFFAEFIDDYEKFMEYELENRVGLYPPFMRLATLTFANIKESVAMDNMLLVLSELKNDNSIEVVGGNKAIVEKIKSKHIYIILIRSNNATLLLRALYNINAKYGNLFEIDIDPINTI